MNDYCVSCERKKEGLVDDDPEFGTGWFYCFKCWNAKERSLDYERQQEYDKFQKLSDEEKDEIRSEYKLAGVNDFVW